MFKLKLPSARQCETYVNGDVRISLFFTILGLIFMSISHLYLQKHEERSALAPGTGSVISDTSDKIKLLSPATQPQEDSNYDILQSLTDMDGLVLKAYTFDDSQVQSCQKVLFNTLVPFSALVKSLSLEYYSSKQTVHSNVLYMKKTLCWQANLDDQEFVDKFLSYDSLLNKQLEEETFNLDLEAAAAADEQDLDEQKTAVDNCITSPQTQVLLKLSSDRTKNAARQYKNIELDEQLPYCAVQMSMSREFIVLDIPSTTSKVVEHHNNQMLCTALASIPNVNDMDFKSACPNYNKQQ